MAQKNRLLFSLLIAILLGALIASLSPGNFLTGWAGAALLLLFSVFGLLSAWKWVGCGKVLAWMMALAFVLRLASGIALGQLLPVYGFDEPRSKEGYVFEDSYNRDHQAWDLAISEQPILSGFQQDFVSDQYGGLLTLSAFLYRFLSPDAHRPYLILILTAFITAAGLPFLWKALLGRWNFRVAAVACGFYAFYPESILLGASQMREPFIIGLGAIAFWAAADQAAKRRMRLGVFVASLAGISLISIRAALPIAGFLLGWVWIEQGLPRLQGRKRLLGWFALVVAAVVGGLLTWNWLQSAASFDVLMTQKSSGWVIKVIKELGGQRFQIPFVVGYGLAQPVLPAALLEDTLPIWRIIASARALGWYVILPLLIYTFWTMWSLRPAKERNIIIWTSMVVLAWMVLVSYRAGGDLWDNPRYRTMLIPWMALLAGWAWDHARTHRDAWLTRWTLVVMVFLGFFFNWYISRYTQAIARMPFLVMVVWILGVSGLIVVSGIFWDLYKRRKKQ